MPPGWKIMVYQNIQKRNACHSRTAQPYLRLHSGWHLLQLLLRTASRYYQILSRNLSPYQLPSFERGVFHVWGSLSGIWAMALEARGHIFKLGLDISRRDANKNLKFFIRSVLSCLAKCTPNLIRWWICHHILINAASRMLTARKVRKAVDTASFILLYSFAPKCLLTMTEAPCLAKCTPNLIRWWICHHILIIR